MSELSPAALKKQKAEAAKKRAKEVAQSANANEQLTVDPVDPQPEGTGGGDDQTPPVKQKATPTQTTEETETSNSITLLTTVYHEENVNGKKVCRFKGDKITLTNAQQAQALLDDNLAEVIHSD